MFILCLFVATSNGQTTLATIKDKSIAESSGLVASRVTGAQARDWEDIAAGPGPQPNKSYLYIGDIGDNDGVRPEVVVYRVAEPALSTATRKFTKSRPGSTEPAEAIRLKYPDGKHDAEALLVNATNGNIYVVNKVPIANPVVYEATAPFTAGKLVTMKRLGEIHVPSIFGGVVTGG